jgi:hypothetical protein
VRLSLRKGAWSVSTPQASTGNRGKGAPSIRFRCGKKLPALKRVVRVEILSRSAKALLPRINAGAPTNNLVCYLHPQFVSAIFEANDESARFLASE